MNPSKESGLALKVGRPRAYSPEELQKEIEEYFSYCVLHTVQQAVGSGAVVKVLKPRVPTMEGLYNYLDITRECWSNYGQQAEYSDIIKKTTEKIRGAKIDALMNGEGNSTGIIFELKAREGWVDKQTVQHEGEINITLNLD
jgi:hypothetical protein